MIRPRPNSRYTVSIWINGAERIGGTFSRSEAARAEARLKLAKDELKRLPKMRLKDAVRRVALGEDVLQASGRTCDAYVRDFLRTASGRGLAPSTLISYRTQLRSFAEQFASIDLGDIDRQLARQWAASQPFSKVKQVRALYYQAIDDGLVQTNPFAKLGIKPNRRERKAITEEELAELVQVARNEYPLWPQFADLIEFAGYTGMRAGELAALKWDDIDSKSLEIRVRRSFVLGEERRPKNGRERTIILPPPALEALRRTPRRMDSPYVFTNTQGQQLRKGSINYHWRQVRASFGRDRINVFHELRHTAATLLLERGVAHADVAIQLGHTDGGRLVMQTYGHPSEVAARQRLKAAFNANIAELKEAASG